MGRSNNCFFLAEQNADHILIYTQEFCEFVCTACKESYHGRHEAFVFGNLHKVTKSEATASVRIFACSPLYKIQDFKQVESHNHSIDEIRQILCEVRVNDG